MKLFLLSVLALSLMIVAGCEEQERGLCSGCGGPDVGQVLIIIDEDSLRLVPGDSTTTAVTVIVVSDDGNVMPGIVVDITLSNPVIGELEFVDSLLGDATNQFGRVELIYRSYATPGKNYICAVCQGIEECDSVVVESWMTPVDQIILFTNPESIHYLVRDSVQVRACVINAAHQGISDAIIFVEQATGYYNKPALTDASGCTEFTWWPPHESGMWVICVTYQHGIACDSVRVEP